MGIVSKVVLSCNIQSTARSINCCSGGKLQRIQKRTSRKWSSYENTNNKSKTMYHATERSPTGLGVK